MVFNGRGLKPTLNTLLDAGSSLNASGYELPDEHLAFEVGEGNYNSMIWY